MVDIIVQGGGMATVAAAIVCSCFTVVVSQDREADTADSCPVECLVVVGCAYISSRAYAACIRGV
jgi:hypothetical protein